MSEFEKNTLAGPSDAGVVRQQDMRAEPLQETTNDDAANNKQTSSASGRDRKRRMSATQFAAATYDDQIHNTQRSDEPTAPKRRKCQCEVCHRSQLETRIGWKLGPQRRSGFFDDSRDAVSVLFTL